MYVLETLVLNLLGEPKIRRFTAETEILLKKRLAEANIFQSKNTNRKQVLNR